MTELPLTLGTPRAGDRLNGGSLAYVKRQSAERQAAAWNAILIDDPDYGPASGYRVGVGSKTAGRFPLVWVPR